MESDVSAGLTTELWALQRVQCSGIVKNRDVFVERTGTYSQRIPEHCTR